jgi:hypothetical protein
MTEERILSDWIFQTDEVSAGVYKVQGQDTPGRSVERTGRDPDKLLEQCRADFVEMMKGSP